MDLIYKFILIFYLCSVTSVTAERMEFLELIKRFDYEGEYHWVTTDDGYILRLDRITYSPVAGENRDKPVVFIMPGITSCSEMFIFWQRNSSLAFLLADAGYDIWVGNTRGTTDSRNHTHLSPDKHPFWHYDIHDVAIKDLPPLMNYILEKTGREQLSYVGHSMGTTMALALLSEMTEYNNKINLVTFLAPIAFWAPEETSTRLAIFTPIVQALREALDAPDYAAEIFSAGGFITKFCGVVIAENACTIFLSIFIGYPLPPVGTVYVDYVTDYFPAGTSLRVLENYVQNIKYGEMRQFDYGTMKNLEIYGQSEPPGYNFSKITAPIAAFSSLRDDLATPLNVAELLPTVPSLVTHFVVPDPTFAHADYFFHKNIGNVYGNRVLELINEYS